MEIVDRMLRTMQDAWGAMGRNGASWEDRDGIGSLLTPAVPQRSLVNGVIPLRGTDIEGAYPWLEERYDGVDAWTVWVPEEDTEVGAFLESRGHHIDGEPAMMV